jgi:hypothetical protein
LSKKGLIVVTEGRRINLRVYRRFFYPIPFKIEGKQYLVYSDTGRQREINYGNPEQYDLENPFNRVRLYRLAKAMDCLVCEPIEDSIIECSVIICTSRELVDSEIREMTWIPFDPNKIDDLETRITKLRRKIQWRKRMYSN